MDMKNVSKIAIGLWILSALILSLLKIFIAPNVGWDIIILAIGLILSLILGGLNMFKFSKSIDAMVESNTIAKEANRIAEEANEISKNVQKKQYEHEKEMERLRQEHDKQVAKEQIIKQLKRFISTEENGISKIDDWHQEKIAEVGNDLKETLKNIEINKISFPQNIEEELFVFKDRIRDVSKIRLVPLRVRGPNQDFEKIQIQNREKRGNKLVEEAREFIKKIEKEKLHPKRKSRDV